MPKIDFNEYQNSVNPPKNNDRKKGKGEMLSVNVFNPELTQYFVKEDNILIDLIKLDDKFDVWMSFLGEDFKLRCEMISKEDLDSREIGEYICYLLNEFRPCLECKSKFLRDLCNNEHGQDSEEITIEFIPDEDDELEDSQGDDPDQPE